MKITKKQLEKIIVEELQKELDEGLWDKIKSGLGNPFKKSQSGQNLSSNVPPPPPSDEEQEVTDDQIQSANDDKKDPMDDVDVDTSEFDQPSQKANPQAAKAKDVFVQTAREFFNSHVRGKMRDQIMSMIASNLSADAERIARAKKKRGLAEQVTANSPRGQAFIIANSIMNEVEKFLSSITPEEFAKVFADVAQSKLKDDPKALKQALKSFRMVESDQKAAQDKSDEEAAREKFIAQNRKRAQAIDQISGERDIAGSSVSKTFSQQLLNLMKLKGLDAAKLVKNAITSTPAEKMGMSQQQKNMVMGKMIATLSKSLSDYFLGKKDNLKFVPSPVEFGDDEKEVPKPKPAAEPAAEPTAQPEQPTAQPEQPTAQPEQPTAQPEQPAAQPEQPASAATTNQLPRGQPIKVRRSDGTTSKGVLIDKDNYDELEADADFKKGIADALKSGKRVAVFIDKEKGLASKVLNSDTPQPAAVDPAMASSQGQDFIKKLMSLEEKINIKPFLPLFDKIKDMFSSGRAIFREQTIPGISIKDELQKINAPDKDKIIVFNAIKKISSYYSKQSQSEINPVQVISSMRDMEPSTTITRDELTAKKIPDTAKAGQPAPEEEKPTNKEIPQPIDGISDEDDEDREFPNSRNPDYRKNKTTLPGGVPGKAFAWSGGSAIKEFKRLQKLAGILKD